MNNLLAPILAVTLLVLLFTIERLYPLRKDMRSLLGRLTVNIAISALAFVAAVALVQPSCAMGAALVSRQAVRSDPSRRTAGLGGVCAELSPHGPGVLLLACREPSRAVSLAIS